jgi:N-acetylmuramoyl-L-alanine amidase-like protein
MTNRTTRNRHRLLVGALVLAAATVAAGMHHVAQASDTLAAQPATTLPGPPIVWKPIPFGPRRRAEMVAYARRHYGIRSATLKPRMIVEHATASTTFSSAYWTFHADRPDAELHELPGICSHFIVDTDGTVYQLVPVDLMCRHTTGLNQFAIGIEHVGRTERDVLRKPRQLNASLALTAWLADRYRIPLANVIGHNESLEHPLRYERYAAWRCQTHADFPRAAMNLYRKRLAPLFRRAGLSTTPTRWIDSACR